jgi:mono/diheme cytochrome c family protein
MPRLGPIVFCLFATTLAAADPTPGAQTVQPSSHKPGTTHGPDTQAVSGASTFRNYCASCHGTGGKGDGPLAANLRFHPPDLTLIAGRRGGEYPAEEIHRIVDGRKPLRGHGGPDMPIWGDAFRSAETGYDDAPAKERIRSVVEYVRTLQVSAKR